MGKVVLGTHTEELVVVKISFIEPTSTIVPVTCLVSPCGNFFYLRCDLSEVRTVLCSGFHVLAGVACLPDLLHMPRDFCPERVNNFHSSGHVNKHCRV